MSFIFNVYIKSIYFIQVVFNFGVMLYIAGTAKAK